MISLSNLQNTDRPYRKVQRVGRGPGSKRGKTSCRGEKGYKSRSGSRCYFGYEGGQLPFFRKLPKRGFTNGRFKREVVAINLYDIEHLFSDGETVNMQSLHDKGYMETQLSGGVKILGVGELKKKVKIEAEFFSKAAKEKLDQHSIAYKQLV